MRSFLARLLPLVVVLYACDTPDRAAELRARFQAEQEERQTAAHDALTSCAVAFDAQRIALGTGLECIHLDTITFREIEALLGAPDHVSDAGWLVYPDLGLSFSPDDIEKPLADRVADSIFVREPFVGTSAEGVRIGVPRATARGVLGPPEDVLLDGTIDAYNAQGVWLHYLANGRLEKIQLFAGF